MKFEALVTSMGPDVVWTTVGVPQDGNSVLSVFHTVSPVSAFNAMMKESDWLSH